MSKDIFVFVECKEGIVRKVSFELLSKGKEAAVKLEGRLTAVVIGQETKSIADSLRSCSDRVISVDQDELKEYAWDSYSAVFDYLLKKYNPCLVFGASTVTGKDLFPRLAARHRVPLVSDAIGIDFAGGKARIRKPLYGGKILSWIECSSESVVFVTFRPNSFSIEKRELDGEVVDERVEIVRETRLKTISTEKNASKKVDLQETDFIICGGRGMHAPENFQALEEIAAIMGGRVGASRAAVDSKWRDYEDQIGKSGKTVSPKLYIACGISGALHHTMGMDTSQVIVAINKDPKAPIFQCADYGITDDIFGVLPVLKDELLRTREEA